MTESGLPGPEKNMVAAANNAVRSTQASTETVFCQLHYYAVCLIFYSYHCTCNWHTKISSVVFLFL
jgi:hypothetical protein